MPSSRAQRRIASSVLSSGIPYLPACHSSSRMTSSSRISRSTPIASAVRRRGSRSPGSLERMVRGARGNRVGSRPSVPAQARFRGRVGPRQQLPAGCGSTEHRQSRQACRNPGRAPRRRGTRACAPCCLRTPVPSCSPPASPRSRPCHRGARSAARAGAPATGRTGGPRGQSHPSSSIDPGPHDRDRLIDLGCPHAPTHLSRLHYQIGGKSFSPTPPIIRITYRDGHSCDTASSTPCPRVGYAPQPLPHPMQRQVASPVRFILNRAKNTISISFTARYPVANIDSAYGWWVTVLSSPSPTGAGGCNPPGADYGGSDPNDVRVGERVHFLAHIGRNCPGRLRIEVYYASERSSPGGLSGLHTARAPAPRTPVSYRRRVSHGGEHHSHNPLTHAGTDA